MMVRMQISLAEEDHRQIKARAAERGISVAEYIRRLVAGDMAPERPRGGIERIFNLGSSGHSDISAHKDEYIGEAVAWEHERSVNRDRTD